MFIAAPVLARTTMNRAADAPRPAFTARPGQFLAFIYTWTLAFLRGSSGVGHELRQTLMKRSGVFSGSCACAPSWIIVPPQERVHRLLRPQHPPDSGEAVREGRVWLVVPGSAEHRERAGPCGLIGSPQRHEREQTEQQRRGPVDGPIRPLPLGFEPEMAPGLLEGGLDRPAPRIPRQDLQG